MKSVRKVIVWTLCMVVAAVLVTVGGFILFSTITEFRPAPVEPVEVSGSASFPVDSTTVFSLISWNLGYGGLGIGMDFFYDGGTRVRPARDYFDQTIERIGNFLQQHDSIDFFLLQEVDRNSKRSYALDEVDWFSTKLPGFGIWFAPNYDCRFVPVPLFDPLGRVTSGLATCSRFQPDSVARYGFDKHVPWPNRLVYLKRCFLVSRYTLPDNRQLIVLNIHNSAFDTTGTLRKREMEMLSQIMIHEYEAGNYLVAGGDWNANPPGFDPEQILTGDRVKQDPFTGLNTFFPGWKFVFDPVSPTNRDVNTAYEKGATVTTIVDFFLLSPNIQVREIKTCSTGFEQTDHQPVSIQIALHPTP